MQKRSRLSKRRHGMVVEYLPLATMLAKFFVQSRPPWQRSVLFPDLEAEGYLALTKAARTYDPKRLPYPKAYFARAIMNAMYKWIKRGARQPGEWKVSLEEAEEFLPVLEHPDYLRLAIEDLPEDQQQLAIDRFQGGQTLRKISEGHQINLRVASVRSRELAKQIAAALDIRLAPRQQGRRCPNDDKSGGPGGRRASGSGGNDPRCRPS